MKGFPKWFIKLNFRLSMPLISLGKMINSVPYLRWLPNIFFAQRFNQVTAIPIRHLEINENVKSESSILPIQIVEMLLAKASNIMILDECVCRSYYKRDNIDIGCMVLGKAALDIHHSAGRIVDINSARAHLKKAADADLVANIAHVWIDPVGFGVTSFDKMLFICFCGEDACLYTDGLKKRCRNLDQAYRKMEGLSVEVNDLQCSGCGVCAEKCFVSAISIIDGKAEIGKACKGCGRCIDTCPERAISLSIKDDAAVFEQLMKRISSLADIG